MFNFVHLIVLVTFQKEFVVHLILQLTPLFINRLLNIVFACFLKHIGFKAFCFIHFYLYMFI